VQHCACSTEIPECTPQRTHSGKSPQARCRSLIEAFALHAHKNARAVAKEAAREIGHLNPAQITPLLIHALFSRWKARLGGNTVLAYRTQLRKLLTLLEGQGAPHIPLPKVRPRQRAVTATTEELALILKEPPASLRLFLLLYFQCGLRRAETLRVTPRCWNRDQHTVTIEVKGGRTRTAHLTPDVEALLTSAGDPDPDTPFLHALHGKPITAAGLNHAWQTYRNKLGIRTEVTTHDLRRTAATIVYTATKDLRSAQQLLGHQNLASTLSYLAPLHPDDARKYAELLRFEHFKSEVKQ
jgi:integrase